MSVFSMSCGLSEMKVPPPSCYSKPTCIHPPSPRSRVWGVSRMFSVMGDVMAAQHPHVAAYRLACDLERNVKPIVIGLFGRMQSA